MNEKLNKLIEQYERETGESAVNVIHIGDKRIESIKLEFVLWLASRPTCGVEQREFLDEVEECGWMYGDGKEMRLLDGTSFLQHDFNADLQKVINGE